MWMGTTLLGVIIAACGTSMGAANTVNPTPDAMSLAAHPAAVILTAKSDPAAASSSLGPSWCLFGKHKHDKGCNGGSIAKKVTQDPVGAAERCLNSGWEGGVKGGAIGGALGGTTGAFAGTAGGPPGMVAAGGAGALVGGGLGAGAGLQAGCVSGALR